MKCYMILYLLPLEISIPCLGTCVPCHGMCVRRHGMAVPCHGTEIMVVQRYNFYCLKARIKLIFVGFFLGI